MGGGCLWCALLSRALSTLCKGAPVVFVNQSSDSSVSIFRATSVPFLSSHHPHFCLSPGPSGTGDQSASPRPLQAKQRAPVSRFNEESPSQEGWGRGFMEALGQMALPGIQPALPALPWEPQMANSSGKTESNFPSSRQELLMS